MKRKKLIAALEKVALGYGCCGTHVADLISEALRRLVDELEKPTKPIG